MKKHRVHITDKALADVDVLLAWFRDQKAEAAGVRWFGRLMAAIETLETMPDRCSLAAEAGDLGLEVRELYLGTRRAGCRVLFEIRGRYVYILRIWHAARTDVSREEL